MAILALYAFWGPIAIAGGIGLVAKYLMKKSADRRERQYYSKRFRMEIG